jgi:hypothetical protein
MRRFARLMLCLAGLAIATTARAQVPYRVEEDWVLVVATPDVAGVGPQITTSMCPAADSTQNPFVAFDLNYREYPSFAPGGYQAQVWTGGQLGQYSRLAETNQFATANETVSWTQRMVLSNGQIAYTIPSGTSTTWGAFGMTTFVSFSTSLADLSGYLSDTSIKNSGVSWQVNNVQSLTLKAVRYYDVNNVQFQPAPPPGSNPIPCTLVSNGAAVTASRGVAAPRDLAHRPDAPGPGPMPAALAARRTRRGEIDLG